MNVDSLNKCVMSIIHEMRIRPQSIFERKNAEEARKLLRTCWRGSNRCACGTLKVARPNGIGLDRRVAIVGSSGPLNAGLHVSLF